MEVKSEVNIWGYSNTIRYGAYFMGINKQTTKKSIKEAFIF